MSNRRVKISVLLDPEEFQRFDTYCQQQEFKKSTLIARLIRDHLDGSLSDRQRRTSMNQDGGR